VDIVGGLRYVALLRHRCSAMAQGEAMKTHAVDRQNNS
jgi:hypothetical protein